MAADLPLCIDHLRYFASIIRAEEGSATELNHTLSLVIQELLGVIGQLIPWNFPLLVATWKIASALAAGCDFFMSASQFAYWQHTQLTIDVTKGRANKKRPSR